MVLCTLATWYTSHNRFSHFVHTIWYIRWFLMMRKRKYVLLIRFMWLFRYFMARSGQNVPQAGEWLTEQRVMTALHGVLLSKERLFGAAVVWFGYLFPASVRIKILLRYWQTHFEFQDKFTAYHSCSRAWGTGLTLRKFTVTSNLITTQFIFPSWPS